MKGVSLAIETIIVIVLAVSVMTVLLFFFRYQFGQTEDVVKLTNKQTLNCQGYLSYDSDCDGTPNLGSNAASASIFENINTACYGLNKQRGDYPSCTQSGSANTPASKECVKECCRQFCP